MTAEHTGERTGPQPATVTLLKPVAMRQLMRMPFPAECSTRDVRPGMKPLTTEPEIAPRA